MENDEPSQLDSLILGEIQVLLSEKRTALSTMRTWIAVFALPLSVLSVLIATSRNYNIGHVMPLLLPLLFLNLGLVVLGSWLVFSIGRLHHYDRRIRELTQKYRSLADVVEYSQRTCRFLRRPSCAGRSQHLFCDEMLAQKAAA